MVNYGTNHIVSCFDNPFLKHNDDVILSAMASRMTILTIAYSSVYSGVDRKKTSILWLWHRWLIHPTEIPCAVINAHKIYLNSLVPTRFERYFREVIFKLILVIDGWGISYEVVLTWTPQVLTDEKSTLVQVMAWCRQAISHNLSQCWPSFLSPYGVTRPQWVNSLLWPKVPIRA